MAALQAAVRAVCLLLLLDSLLQLLFPQGSWQRVLRLISGLLMAVLLLQPLAALRQTDLALPQPIAISTRQTGAEQGALLLSALSASAGRQQQRQLAEQAAALARLSSGGTVDSWWEEEVLHLQVDAAVDAAQLRRDIACLLQLEERMIEVSISDGAE